MILLRSHWKTRRCLPLLMRCAEFKATKPTCQFKPYDRLFWEWIKNVTSTPPGKFWKFTSAEEEDHSIGTSNSSRRKKKSGKISWKQEKIWLSRSFRPIQIMRTNLIENNKWQRPSSPEMWGILQCKSIRFLNLSRSLMNNEKVLPSPKSCPQSRNKLKKWRKSSKRNQ